MISEGQIWSYLPLFTHCSASYLDDFLSFPDLRLPRDAEQAHVRAGCPVWAGRALLYVSRTPIPPTWVEQKKPVSRERVRL